MLEEFGVDGFCLISFQGVSPRDIVKILVRGVQIGDRVFRFIGHSNSQLRSKTCWFLGGVVEPSPSLGGEGRMSTPANLGASEKNPLPFCIGSFLKPAKQGVPSELRDILLPRLYQGSLEDNEDVLDKAGSSLCGALTQVALGVPQASSTRRQSPCQLNGRCHVPDPSV